MPTFSLSYLLIPFALIFLFSLVFFFFNIFHLKRYGIRQGGTWFMIGLYTVAYGTAVLVISGYLFTVDWSQVFSLADILPFSTTTGGLDYGL